MVSPGGGSPRRAYGAIDEPPDAPGSGRGPTRGSGGAATGASSGSSGTVHRRLALPLAQQMAMEWARTDIIALSIIATIELCILMAGLAHGTISQHGVAGSLVVLALNCAATALAAWQPTEYAARWRLPLMTVTRLANMVLYPSTVDLLNIMGGSSTEAAVVVPTGAAAAHGLQAGLHQAANWVRGAAMLLIPVAGIHACLLVALHLQLPPLAHTAVQAVSVAALARRAPAVCQQFVAAHPAHGHVAETAHWLLCQVVGTACLGTREHLNAAAGLLSPADKCAAVAWTLEACLGLVLATLLVWQQQVREARWLALLKARLSPEAEVEAAAELLRSPYIRICQPVLAAASLYGSLAFPIAGTAVASLIASFLLLQR
ncbi:hypothetical protein ABPG75_000398 [Micractinium tetrahymenae]